MSCLCQVQSRLEILVSRLSHGELLHSMRHQEDNLAPGGRVPPKQNLKHVSQGIMVSRSWRKFKEAVSVYVEGLC